MQRQPHRAALVVAVVSCALWLGACGSDSDDKAKSSKATAAAAEKTIEGLQTKQVIARVEGLRGKRFERPPVVEAVTPEESARHFKELATRLSSRRQFAIEEQLKLLGLVPGKTDLGELGSTLGGDAALGFYQSPPPRVALVAGRQTKDPTVAEELLAHELTHALDDQYHGIFERLKALGDEADEGVAYAALVEGDATAIELAYVKKFAKVDVTELHRQDAGGLKSLPFALQLSTSVIYLGGSKFVAALAKDGGSRAIDRAFKSPPTSSAAILHPRLYRAGFEPTQVELDVDAALGGGWTRLSSDSFGELDVLTLLAFSEQQVEPADRAAEGWRGGQVELWRRGSADPKQCPAPCVDRDVLVIGLNWTSAKDAAQFERAFAGSLKRNRGAKPASAGTFEVAGGGVGVRSSGSETTIAYAPSAQQAATLSKRSR